ncbi:hypothetical protein BDR04DRAFT_1129368 [Suillus decipiens]|nr:hypothetical protein BDR04DRAFT_1129368 [Suillus decipiens]
MLIHNPRVNWNIKLSSAACLQGIKYSGDEHDFTDEDHDQVIFANNQLHEHGVLQQDTINPQTRADIMVLSHEDDDKCHPYWYAQIFGTTVTRTPLHQNHVLFICWFACNVTFKGGWLGLFTGNDPGCFRFLDPDQVIHGVHLIPAFAHGRTDHYMGPSFVRHEEDGDEDWWYHYTIHNSNYCTRFVDRDMFMRFRSGGVGHKVTREWDNFLQSDGAPANAPADDEEWDDVDMDARENGKEDGEEDGEEDEEDGKEGEEGEEGEEDGEDEEDSDDRVEADSDEELDDDVLA